ncbi:hypothetical protein BH20ACT24_BH20ACT24_00980 [soil metagenome]
MNVKAFLADSVTNAEGKLYVQGAGWNVINAAAIPLRHDRIGIGILVIVPYTATNQNHGFELRLEDADANLLPLGDAPPNVELPEGKVRKLGGGFTVGRPPFLKAGDEQIIAIAVNLDGLLFENEGGYRFVITVDGNDQETLPFRVQKPPVVPGPILS